MKKKINLQLLEIATLAIISTMVITVAIFYNLFTNQVMDDLKSYTYIIEKLAKDQNFKQLNELNSEHLRITIIGQGGSVLYDSDFASETLENHGDRPEIARAKIYGEGESIRRSTTMEKTNFYYARQLTDGIIIRIGKEAGSVIYMLGNAVPYIIGLIILLLLVCVVLAHYLTKSLVKPIEEIAANMDNIDEIPIYKELVPFINTIQRQHQDILKNAMMRQEFTANVSHELKTPLTSISGYSELIENGMATAEDTVRFAGEIHRNATRLLNQINDIIHLSELDSSKNQVTLEPVNIYQISQTCVDMLQINAEKHQVSIFFDGIPSLIMGDKGMLEELIYNLCDNAIRYNNKGGIVNVTVRPEGEKVILTVEDTGIGISKEHQERIFERYYRVDKGRSQSTGGTGLGLAIVKHIVSGLNGQMTLESEKGKGTKIQVVFDKKEW